MPRSSDIPRPMPGAFEANPKGKLLGIQIINMSRKDSQGYIVKPFSLNAYEDEITVIYGHRSSGKTAIFNMLAGIVPPSEGTAIITGQDLCLNKRGVRKFMNLCPEYNIIFDDLSVRDHVYFYSQLRGRNLRDTEKEVAKFLKFLNLADKSEVTVGSLSFIIKRKISVVAALCGRSKVVLLDEPTSGMDSMSRRDIWNLLQQEKRGRTLLVMSTVLEEAQEMADRVGLLVNGELKCFGTPMFLMKQYADGTKLVITKTDDCYSDNITTFLEKYIGGISPERENVRDITYILPYKFGWALPNLLRDLEQKSKQLKIAGINLYKKSMLEVFLNIDNLTSKKQQFEQHLQKAKSIASVFSKPTLVTGKQLLRSRLRILLHKKWLYSHKHWKVIVIQTSVSLLYFIYSISTHLTQFPECEPMTMDLSQYPAATVVLHKDLSEDTDGSDKFMNHIAEEYSALVYSYDADHYKVEETKEPFNEFVLEDERIDDPLFLQKYLVALTVKPRVIYAWFNNKPLHTMPLSLNMAHNAIARALLGMNTKIHVINKPLPFTAVGRLQRTGQIFISSIMLASHICISMSLFMCFALITLVKARVDRAKLLQRISGASVYDYWLTHLFYDLATFGAMAFLVDLILYACGIPGFNTLDKFVSIYILFLIFGICNYPFLYVFSFSSSEWVSGFFACLSFNITLVLSRWFMLIVPTLQSYTIVRIIVWTMHLFPVFNLVEILAQIRSYSEVESSCMDPTITALPEEDICYLYPVCCQETHDLLGLETGYAVEFIFLIFNLPLHVLIVWMLETNRFNIITIYLWRFRRYFDEESRPLRAPSADVLNEKKRVEDAIENNLAGQDVIIYETNKYFGRFRAVSSLSLCATSGECYCLAGARGAGKTTICQMLTGEQFISSGCIYVKGKKLSTSRNFLIDQLGYCPQQYALIDYLTLRENMELHFALRGVEMTEVPQRIVQLAKCCGLEAKLDKYPDEINYSNTRRMNWAMALIGDVSIILLDEPITGADPESKRDFWNLLRLMREQKKTVIYTMRSVEKSLPLSTRVAILLDGSIFTVGTQKELSEAYKMGVNVKVLLKPDKGHLPAPGNADYVTFKLQFKKLLWKPYEENIKQTKALLADKFPESIFLKLNVNKLSFVINYDEFTWPELFEALEDNMFYCGIKDYIVTRRTINEIYSEIVKFQRVHLQKQLAIKSRGFR